MTRITAASVEVRHTFSSHREDVDEILRRYDAGNPRLFGSVARGDARRDSDIDLMVDLVPGRGNELLRLSGLAEELSSLLGRRVDVVSESLLRDEVSLTARQDAVPV
ncbi:MAG: nucleotidyltransferase family protein [Dermatophilaceae bacterium]